MVGHRQRHTDGPTAPWKGASEALMAGWKHLRTTAVVVAVLLSGGALAVAAVPDGDGRFTGCVHKQTGVLRVIDAAVSADQCKSKESRITWNEQGPRGVEGPVGPQGLAGAVGPQGPPGSFTALEQLDGLSCKSGAGVVDLVYGTDGAVSLRCVSGSPPPPPPPTGCGDLIAFSPRATLAYDDYPFNGETTDNQYRSYLRREFVPPIQSAANLVQRTARESTSGHGAPIGLGDMSECDGSIPGTSVGAPGHPAGTHTGGLDIDVAYYQTGTPDNHIRPVCESQVNRVEQNHCVAPPDRLDAYRTALFLEALASAAPVRVIGVDGRIGPVLEATLERLCADRVTTCTRVPLAYETTDQGMGWFSFHHHHMHISFNRPAG